MLQKFLHAFAAHFEGAPTPGWRSGATPARLAILAAIIAVGAGVRLWELGAVGLHGDEETMAMPTMHIVEHGSPILPSGMFYPRALGQLYLMAGSVTLFGGSEWAMRLPSVLCGTLLIVFAYFLGRRFLAPAWNLAFTAAVAFLPAFIVDAQTARMYTFLVTSIAVMMLLIFRWERTGSLGALLGAFGAFVVGLHFHSLAVFSAFLFLFPGLLQGDSRKLLQGLVAFGLGIAAFAAIESWVASFYPPMLNIESVVLQDGAKARGALPQPGPAFAIGAAAAAMLLGFMVARRVALRPAAWAAFALIAAGVLAQIMFFYHLALLLLAAGAVIALRSDARTRWPLLALVAAFVAILIAHVVFLRASGVDSMRQLFGALTGRPSVWPLLVVAQYSVAAALAAALAVLASLRRLARGERIPDFVLFLALAVWAPLLVMGVLEWYVPLRYTSGQTLPLLLAGCAAAQWAVLAWRARPRAAAAAPSVPLGTAAAIAAAAAFVNPVALAQTAGAGYAMHPDHKGAAEYIRSQLLAPNDVVLAEDVLQQTYYLGKVDYWLIGQDRAAQFVREVDGAARDIYTGTPVLGSAAELEALLARPDRGSIYIIGSGEDQSDGRRTMRSHGIFEFLESRPLEVVYEGRDGLTKIWRVRPHPQASVARHAAAR